MELKTYWGGLIFALEGAKTVLEVVNAAIDAKKSLRDADLRGADLRGANLGDANLRDANLRDADLRGANLRDANLRGANLGGANLRDANLSDADLGDANLGGADLRDADLSGADLRGADLGGANLSGADLGDANLRDADLRGANLRDANLRGANLGDANLRGADLRGADLSDGLDGVPIIPDIHKAIYLAASAENALDMVLWHSCDTTHCRAGWVVTLAGAGGKALEWAMGTPAAAAIIYMASDPKLEKVPNFYASNEDALEDMKKLAGV